MEEPGLFYCLVVLRVMKMYLISRLQISLSSVCTSALCLSISFSLFYFVNVI